jgi:hypothetical protein
MIFFLVNTSRGLGKGEHLLNPLCFIFILRGWLRLSKTISEEKKGGGAQKERKKERKKDIKEEINK